jgi:heme-degrading monooxygenase HmoA
VYRCRDINAVAACWRVIMFSALFEVQPRKDEWDVYLTRANMRRTELEQAPGFVDDIHYSSLTRDGWILSLSGWRDEASVLGWHTRMLEDEAGKKQILPDFRLRVGEVTSDPALPEGQKFAECRLHGSEAGGGTYLTLIDAKQTLEWVSANNPQEMAIYLGFDLYSYGDCISWDIFDSLSNPGEILLVVTWKDAQSANDHAATQIVPDDARVRVVRVVCDHAMSENPGTLQHSPDAAGRETIRA